MSLALGIPLSFVAVVPFLALLRAQALAQCALAGSHRKRWNAWCTVTALRTWVVAGLVIVWLSVGLHRGWLSSEFAKLVIIALVVGVLAGALLTSAMNVKQAYWSIVHKTLESALRDTVSEQATAFNRLHTRLLNGRNKERRTVLARVIAGS